MKLRQLVRALFGSGDPLRATAAVRALEVDGYRVYGGELVRYGELDGRERDLAERLLALAITEPGTDVYVRHLSKNTGLAKRRVKRVLETLNALGLAFPLGPSEERWRLSAPRRVIIRLRKVLVSEEGIA